MKTVVFPFLLLLVINLSAQDSLPASKFLPRNTFAPSLNFYPGYLPKTYPVAPVNNYAALGSVGIMWQFNGKDRWHQLYHYPRGGIELLFGTFDNTRELGHVIGFVPTLEINNKNPTKKWKGKFGIGVAYFNKPYDAVSNTSNYYIGSHFTNMTTLSALREVKMRHNLSFTYGASLIHASDGHTKLPNVGMNLLLLNAGLRMAGNRPQHAFTIAPDQNKLSYAVKAGLGMHQFGLTEKAVGGPTYPSYHLSAWVSKPFRNIHLLQVGITCAYYRSFYTYITSQELRYKHPQLHASTGLAFIGHEFIFGKFGLSTQMGFYFYNAFFIQQKKIEGTWSSASEKIEAFNTNRLGLIYYPLKKKNSLNNVKNQLMIGAFIKANLAQADLFEYSIGYVF